MSFYTSAWSVASPVGRLLFNVRREGIENLPAQGPAIVCANHKANADSFILAISVTRPLFFMAKAELFRVPLVGPLVRALGAFPVHRGKGDGEAIRLATEIVERGDVLAMFPEGHRLKHGETPQRFRSGAALIAYRTKAPVVPAALVTKGRTRMFKRTTVRVGKPIAFEEFGFTDGGVEDIRRASDLIRQRVLMLLGQAQP